MCTCKRIINIRAGSTCYNTHYTPTISDNGGTTFSYIFTHKRTRNRRAGFTYYNTHYTPTLSADGDTPPLSDPLLHAHNISHHRLILLHAHNIKVTIFWYYYTHTIAEYGDTLPLSDPFLVRIYTHYAQTCGPRGRFGALCVYQVEILKRHLHSHFR